MSKEWKEYRFSELLSEPVRNGIYKKKEFHGRGQRIVNMGELFGHSRLFDVEMKRVELNENELKKSLLNEGDLIFARRSLTAEGAGKCSIVKTINEKTTFESSIIRARPNKTLTDSDFLYYYFSSSLGKSLMYGIMRQVAVAGITGTDLMKLTLRIPPLAEQKAIAGILGKLDDKIELNRQMNQTLEQMAQALFQSWFVDFDPVIDNALAQGNEIPEALAQKAEKRKIILDRHSALDAESHDLPDEIKKLFPKKFTFNDTLNKWIPEGWEGNHIGEFVDLSQGLAINAKSKYLLVEEGLPLLRITDLLNDTQVQFIDEDNVPQKCVADPSEIIFTRTGQVGLVYTNKKGVVHNNCFKVLSKGALLNKYIYWFLKRDEIYDYTNSVASGSVQKDLNHSAFKTIPMVCPSMSVQQHSEEYWENLNKKLVENQKQTKTLTQLREVLLPQLISGKLSVPEAMLEVEKVVSV